MTVAEALVMAIESLDYTEQRFRDYSGYPSYEFKQQRIAEAQEAKKLLRAMRRKTP